MSRLRRAAAPLPWFALQLAGLNALVVAWPAFEPRLQDPSSLMLKAASAPVIVAFALVVLLAIPLALVLAELLAGLLSRRAQLGLHVLLVAAFLALFARNGLRDLGAGRLIGTAGALAVAVVAVRLFLRSPAMRSWLSVLGAAPVVVLLLFLVFSPVRGLVFPGAGPAAVDAPSSGAPVVMIVFDELPLTSLLDGRRRIDPERYPNFARLAATATWYREAKTVADHTTYALPAIVTGSRPERGALPHAADHPDSLFRLLGGTYRLDVASVFADLCPRAACPARSGPPPVYVLRRVLAESARTMRVFPDWIADRLGERLAPESPPPMSPAAREAGHRRQAPGIVTYDDGQRAADLVEALGPSRGRTLTFGHLLTPHSPWHHLPGGQSYSGSHSFARDVRPRDPVLTAYYQRQHLAEVGYADRVLGMVLDRLEALGTLDGSLVVVAADHGVAFVPGGRDRDTDGRIVGQIAAVPLLVKAPGQTRGRIDDTPVETTDIVPTLAALLRIELPWRVDGSPAARVAAGSRPELELMLEDGTSMTVARTRLATLEAAALRDKLRRFRSGDPFAMGPLGERLGEPVADVPSATGLRASVRVATAEVRGGISGAAPRSRPLAIAIDGRIRATTESVVTDGRERFVALLPRVDADAGRIRVLTTGPGGGLAELGYQR